jgi:hypothetical protein
MGEVLANRHDAREPSWASGDPSLRASSVMRRNPGSSFHRK